MNLTKQVNKVKMVDIVDRMYMVDNVAYVDLDMMEMTKIVDMKNLVD